MPYTNTIAIQIRSGNVTIFIGPHDVALSAVVATADGAAVSESHFNNGLLFSHVPIVFVSNTSNVAILQGYLAKR